MIKYPEYAKELVHMLREDQRIWKAFWAVHFGADQATQAFRDEFEAVRKRQQKHTKRMLAILNKVKQPSLSNIGPEAAQAVSILALHDSLSVLRQVCAMFELSYKHNRTDAYYQAIPSMVDRIRILERKPQVFGTQWEFDADMQPFLPTVESFKYINERRDEYGVEPLRWPKSLAIPAEKQPWLRRPLSEAVMRDISGEEFEAKYRSYVD